MNGKIARILLVTLIILSVGSISATSSIQISTTVDESAISVSDGVEEIVIPIDNIQVQTSNIGDTQDPLEITYKSRIRN